MRCTSCNVPIESGTFCRDCMALLSSPTESAEVNPPFGVVAATPRRVVPGRVSSGTLITDRYRIVRHLGSGGMGVVYQAEDLKLNVTVALKFLTSDDTGDGRRLQLFLNEVRLARQITHPNVCRVFDV